MLAKFALLDESDHKALDMLKEEIEQKKKLLIKEFEGKKLRYWKYGGRMIEYPCILLTSKVKQNYINRLRED